MSDPENDAAENEARPDLMWDDEVRGLCIRGYGDGSQSFIFVYRIGDRQRFLRIGRSPDWSLKAARMRAKELRSIVDQGRDPADDQRDRRGIATVEKFLRYISEARDRLTAEKTDHPAQQDRAEGATEPTAPPSED